MNDLNSWHSYYSGRMAGKFWEYLHSILHCKILTTFTWGERELELYGDMRTDKGHELWQWEGVMDKEKYGGLGKAAICAGFGIVDLDIRFPSGRIYIQSSFSWAAYVGLIPSHPANAELRFGMSHDPVRICGMVETWFVGYMIFRYRQPLHLRHGRSPPQSQPW